MESHNKTVEGASGVPLVRCRRARVNRLLFILSLIIVTASTGACNGSSAIVNGQEPDSTGVVFGNKADADAADAPTGAEEVQLPQPDLAVPKPDSTNGGEQGACQTATDCKGLISDSECQVAACVGGKCQVNPVEDDKPCSMTVSECQVALCRSGSCTAANRPKGEPCPSTKLNPCIVDALCDGNGLCGGGKNPCQVDGQCTGLQSTCTPVGNSYVCDHSAYSGKGCADGNGCTVGDSCAEDGTCKPGTSEPTCADPKNPCRSVSKCVNDGGESYHCSYSENAGKTCQSGKLCTAASCDDAGSCVDQGPAAFATPCKTANSTGLCNVSGGCMTLAKWHNAATPPTAPPLPADTIVAAMTQTSDGAVWSAMTHISISITGDPPNNLVYHHNVNLTMRRHNADQLVSSQTPLPTWERQSAALTQPAPDIACDGDYCVILEDSRGMTWNKDAGQLDGDLFVLRYQNGTWSRAASIEAALRAMMSNGTLKPYYTLRRLLSLSTVSTPTATELVIAGRLFATAKDPLLVLCQTPPCYQPVDNRLIACVRNNADGKTTCSLTAAAPNTVTVSQQTTELDLISTKIKAFFVPAQGKTALVALHGVIDDPYYLVAGGQWRLQWLLDNAWTSVNGCDGLGPEAPCLQDLPFTYGWPQSADDHPRGQRGLLDMDASSPSNIYVVGEPLKSELEDPTQSVAIGAIYHFNGQGWRRLIVPVESLALGKEAPAFAGLWLNQVVAVDSQTTLFSGFTATCDGASKSDCGVTVPRTQRSVLLVYRPQQDQFESVVPLTEPFVCCQSCSGATSYPPCSGTLAQPYWRNGAKRLLVLRDRSGLYIGGHDNYRSVIQAGTSFNGIFGQAAIWSLQAP